MVKIEIPWSDITTSFSGAVINLVWNRNKEKMIPLFDAAKRGERMYFLFTMSKNNRTMTRICKSFFVDYPGGVLKLWIKSKGEWIGLTAADWADRSKINGWLVIDER